LPERITEIVRRLVSRAEAPTPLLDISAELIHGPTVWSRGAGMAVALYECDEHMRAVRVEQEQQDLRAQQAGRNAGDRADGGCRTPCGGLTVLEAVRARFRPCRARPCSPSSKIRVACGAAGV
jgi:hypothetical protein